MDASTDGSCSSQLLGHAWERGTAADKAARDACNAMCSVRTCLEHGEGNYEEKVHAVVAADGGSSISLKTAVTCLGCRQETRWHGCSHGSTYQHGEGCVALCPTG